MNSVPAWLQANEPVISAVVGIVTLVAALWGFVELALLPFLRATRAEERQDNHESDASRPLSIWSVLVNRGVDPVADLADQVAGRTLNACVVVIMVTSLTLLMLVLLQGDLERSIGNLMFFLAVVVCYALATAGAAHISRWLIIVSTTVFWSYNMLLTGPEAGLEYCLAGVLMLPLLLFDRDQNRQLYFAAAAITLTLPLSLWAEQHVSSVWPFSTQSIPPYYYYGNAIAVALMIFAALLFYNRSADASFHQLEDQESKSSELIHSLLPAYVAEKAQARGENLTDWHSEATVLFATVTGFDSLYHRVSAIQLLEIIREVFDAFDELVDDFGVEKINTLGTNYVAAIGIDPEKVASSVELAKVALGMRDIVNKLRIDSGHPFGVRVGMSTGDVVSGVIGEERPSFDIWGNTVELANTIRDDAEDNAIVINEAAFWRVKGNFELIPDEQGDGYYRLVR